MLFLLALIWKLQEKAFSTQVLPQKLLKEATIHFYCVFDESRYSDANYNSDAIHICTIMELKELNSLSKQMKNVRSSQPRISMNFVLNSAKSKFFHVSIVKLPSVVSSNPFLTGNFLCNKTWARFIVSPESHWLLDNSFSIKLLYTWLKQIFSLFFCCTVSVILRSVCGLISKTILL